MQTFLIFLIVVLLMYRIKNEVTYRNFKKLSDAIYCYNEKEIRKRNFKDLLPFQESFVMSYEMALLRFWDWGCDQLVSKETYEKIKEFL